MFQKFFTVFSAKSINTNIPGQQEPCVFKVPQTKPVGFTHPVVVAVVEVTSSEVDDNESSDSDDVVCRCW